MVDKARDFWKVGWGILGWSTGFWGQAISWVWQRNKREGSESTGWGGEGRKLMHRKGCNESMTGY